jgi:hypothetical protein
MRKMGDERPELLTERISPKWIDCLTIPGKTDGAENPITFAQKGQELLLLKAQE